MFIYTAKLSKWKLLSALGILAALLVCIVLLAHHAGAKGQAPVAATRLGSQQARAEFLSGCGYQVSETPERIQEVRIPEEFNEVYTQYNRLQQSQGFDLTKYRGKTVMQYVYRVENYPDDNGEPVYATLLVYREKLIGGDLSRGGTESFLRPLLTA